MLVKLLTKTAKVPTKAYASDAGFDLYADEYVNIESGKVGVVSTGIAVAIPVGYYGRVAERSSLGSKGLALRAGVIDSSYRGEVKVVFYNASGETFYVSPGRKIAQLIVTAISPDSIEVVDNLPPTDRGSNGFGSSGST